MSRFLQPLKGVIIRLSLEWNVYSTKYRTTAQMLLYYHRKSGKLRKKESTFLWGREQEGTLVINFRRKYTLLA